MKRIQISKFVCICFLPLVLLILIFSFLLSSVLNHHKHHHNLIFSTYEFIIVAKSSRVAVFVTCNVIIITIFLGSLKSPTGGDSDQLFSLSTTSVLHETDGAKEKEYDGDFDIVDDNEDDDDDDDDDDDEEEEEEEEEEFHGYDGYDEDNDDDVNAEDVDSEEDDDEIDSSDLHKKIEEFIDKVYKKWKEETVAERLLCIAATEFN